MKHVFLINPAAGKSDSTLTVAAGIRAVCVERGLDYDILTTEHPRHAVELVKRKAVEYAGQAIRFYACGGDGTLNEVAAGAAGLANVSITHFPCGSGNDFIKLFNDPTAFRDLEKLLDCREDTFDLIRCNEDYSINICSVGLDARIGTEVDRYKRLPLVSGFGAYVLSSVVNVIRRVHEHYVVELDGQVFDGRHTLICACNGRYYGGGFNPVPEADPTDGLLDVLLIKKVSRLKLATVIGKYKNGKYRELADLVEHIKTDKLQILCNKPTPINLDGELRMGQQVDISVAKEKVRFFYPKGLVWEKEAALAK